MKDEPYRGGRRQFFSFTDDETANAQAAICAVRQLMQWVFEHTNKQAWRPTFTTRARLRRGSSELSFTTIQYGRTTLTFTTTAERMGHACQQQTHRLANPVNDLREILSRARVWDSFLLRTKENASACTSVVVDDNASASGPAAGSAYTHT